MTAHQHILRSKYLQEVAELFANMARLFNSGLSLLEFLEATVQLIGHFPLPLVWFNGEIVRFVANAKLFYDFFLGNLGALKLRLEFLRYGERFFSIKELVNLPELFVINLIILVVHQDT
jgi:hypothetical protein